MSSKYGKCSSSLTYMVSHFPSRLFLKEPIKIAPLNSLYFLPFVTYLFVPCDDIPYRTGTNTFIHITINLIDSARINNIYRDFFGPYI